MKHALVLLLAAIVTLAVACSGVVDTSSMVTNVGSAQIVASLWQAPSPGDVTRVTVTTSAPDMAAPIEATLIQVDGGWNATSSSIPAGKNRTFRAAAYDASDTLLLTGVASSVTIHAGVEALVAITLEPPAPAQPGSDQPLVIDSVVGSMASPEPGDSVGLTVVAHSVDPGDTVGFAWVAGPSGGTTPSPDDGSFIDASSATTTWVAPASEGPKLLTLIASDESHHVATMSLSMLVIGSAKVTVSFNTWPVVKSVIAAPTRIDVGQSTTLTAKATDAQGNPLTYAWTSTCSGTFSNPTSVTTSFTIAAPLPASASCTLTVTVNDGKGGHDTGSVVIQTGPGVSVDVAPQIGVTYQSSETTTGGNTVTFRAAAIDPGGNPLTFAWKATDGSLGPAASGAGSSQVVWSSPQCILAGVTPTVTVTVSDSTGASASRSFTVTPTIGAVCPAPVTVVGTNGLKNLAVNATTLYYATTGALSSVPLGGGSSKTIASGQGSLNAVLLDPTSVYWSDLGSGTNGSITKKPFAGGAATVLASGLGQPTGIARDPSYVYWASQASGGWQLFRVPVGGGAQQSLATVAGTFSSIALAVDATSIYFTEYGPSGGVYKVPLAGSATPTVLATGQNNPTLGAVDATNVYWTNAGTAPSYADGAVMMVALSGGIPTVLASNQCQPEGAKVDGAGIYWADVCADSVSTVALGGGTITTLATGQAKLGGLVLGPSTIYWTSSTGVMSVPK